MVQELYGKKYLSARRNSPIFTSKTKGAQEAHEAIRPAGAEFAHPDSTGLSW
jgi:DNA topoisomerase I